MSGPHAFEVADLVVGYGGAPILRGVTFAVRTGSIFAIMGGSGCGKSTLLRAATGLLDPVSGTVRLLGQPFLPDAPEKARQRLLRRTGFLFQSAALWSSLTVAENVALPLEEFTELSAADIAATVELKLALVGLGQAGARYPSELSGGMRKRAGLARALALDPDLVFFDEPSAGLDPITSRHLDDLILRVRDETGATVVLVTHELPTILGICEDSIMLSAETRSIVAQGAPRELAAHPPHPSVAEFLTRGGTDHTP